MSEEILVTAQQLRDIIADEIKNSIELRRRATGHSDQYTEYADPVSDEEVTDFIFSNALFDADLVQQLFDPGLLGFASKSARATIAWIETFKEDVASWAGSNSWLAGDPPYWSFGRLYGLEETRTWSLENGQVPSDVRGTRSALVLAEEILQNRGRLSEMDWRIFEKLVAELLERDGFSVVLTRGSKDGGIDVIADKADPTLGNIRTIWQAKKYRDTRKVGLSSVRELSAIRDRSNSSKAFLVTTSRLTTGAIRWIRQDRFRLDFREHDDLVDWVLGSSPKIA